MERSLSLTCRQSRWSGAYRCMYTMYKNKYIADVHFLPLYQFLYFWQCRVSEVLLAKKSPHRSHFALVPERRRLGTWRFAMHGWMVKRKSEEALDFFKVTGVSGLNDNLIRTVLKRLKNEDTTEKLHGGTSVKRRFPELQHFIKEHDCGLTTVDLQRYIDKLLALKPEFLKLFESTVLATQRSQGAVQAFVYVDEVVPGNIIAPDNKRRSFCYYICWKDLVKFRSDVLWFPLAIIRHDNVEKCEGELVGVFSKVLKDLQPFLCSLLVGDNMVHTTRLYFIADEDGLKKSSSHKGASGLRPCIKCKNCISKGNSVPGYFDISECNWSNFQLATDAETMEMLTLETRVCKFKQERFWRSFKAIGVEVATATLGRGWRSLESPESVRFLLWQSSQLFQLRHGAYGNWFVSRGHFEQNTPDRQGHPDRVAAVRMEKVFFHRTSIFWHCRTCPAAPQTVEKRLWRL